MKYEHPFVGMLFRPEKGEPDDVIFFVISDSRLSEITVATDGEEETFRAEDAKCVYPFINDNLKAIIVKEFKDRKVNKHTAEAKATDVNGRSFIKTKTKEKRNGDFWEEY